MQIIANDFAVLPPHMGALHQQQQQQRSRMLGLMQSTAAPNPAQQFVPPAALRMPFHSSSNTNTARGLFPNPTESSAPNTDAVYYPRPPVLFCFLWFFAFLHPSGYVFLLHFVGSLVWLLLIRITQQVVTECLWSWWSFLTVDYILKMMSIGINRLCQIFNVAELIFCFGSPLEP